MIRRGLRIDDDDVVSPIKEQKVSNFFIMKVSMPIERKTHLNKIWTAYYLGEPQ